MRSIRLLGAAGLALACAGAVFGPAPSAVTPARAEEAFSDAYGRAYALYTTGEYLEAAEAASSLDTARGYSLAARALNGIVYFEKDDARARDLLARAQKYAEQAVELDPSLDEARLQLAFALAARGARLPRFKTLMMRLIPRARQQIDAVLERDPDDAWANSVSGAWNIEVGRAAGDMFGADIEKGVRDFEKAYLADPENLMIAYEFALRLSALDRPAYDGAIGAALDRALSLEPETAMESAVQEKARELKAARAEGPEATRDFVEAQS